MADFVEEELSSPSKEKASRFYSHLKTDEQRELFLWKYKDVTRDAILEMEKDFIKHNKTGTGELNEHEALRLFEDRGLVKTVREMRDMFVNIDYDGNHMISFIEWCCAWFDKDYEELNDFSDEEARLAALEEAKAAGMEAEKVLGDIEIARKKKEDEAAARALEIENESKLTGVQGMRAFFFRQVEGVSDKTKTNEQTIKEEFARRKALREAKAKAASAEAEARKVKSPEEVAEEAYKSARRSSMVRHQSDKMQADMEKAARQMRKDELNAKWGGSSSKSP